MLLLGDVKRNARLCKKIYAPGETVTRENAVVETVGKKKTKKMARRG